jgi:cytochrome c5
MSNKPCIITILSLLWLGASCTGKDYSVREPAPRIDSPDISEVIVTLPEAEGKELVEISCVPCHSLRYIEMQPALSKKAWEKTVTKMIKIYGAPVRDSISAAKIVEYLAHIKGTG